MSLYSRHKKHSSGASHRCRIALNLSPYVFLLRQTLEDSTVTLRERDSTAQVRITKADVPALVRQLSDASLTWSQVQATYPAVLKAEAVDE